MAAIWLVVIQVQGDHVACESCIWDSKTAKNIQVHNFTIQLY